MGKSVTKIRATDYPIFIGDIFKSLNDGIVSKKYSSIFILADENTAKHCLPVITEKFKSIHHSPAFASAAAGRPFTFHLISIPPGEQNKILDTVEFIWSKLVEGKADRHSILINLGGGVVTDIGGFAAATYKRGVDFIHVPTTLLSMADASIGGKTGFDFREIKNSIGLIKNPQAVFIYPGFLKTLPVDEFKSGLAEIIKHGLIAGKKTWKDILDLKTNVNDISADKIAATVKIKLSIVQQDPDEKNIRRQLNFGHTIGHALESWMIQKGEATFHGYCVAAGMIAEMHLSEQLAGLSAKERDEAQNLLLSIFPKINFNEQDIDAILSYMEQDKKNTSGKIGFVLLNKPGKMLIDQFVEKEKIKEALDYYRLLQ